MTTKHTRRLTPAERRIARRCYRIVSGFAAETASRTKDASNPLTGVALGFVNVWLVRAAAEIKREFKLK